MKIVPINFADFGLVEVKTTNECTPTPHCKKHGAMNKMNLLEDGGGYWRCISAVSNKNDTYCRAGCCEIKNKSIWKYYFNSITLYCQVLLKYLQKRN